MSKKSRIILSTALGVGAAIATAATIAVFAMRKKIDINREETKFVPTLSLKSSGYNFLSFNIDNLNVEKFKDKDVQVLLIDKTTINSPQMKVFKISGNSQEITFDGLTENKVYTVEIKYDSQTYASQSFSTKARPKISSNNQTATSATILLTNLKDLPGSLENVQIVIKNESKPESKPITIKASDLNLTDGNALLDLKNANLGLEPGSNYSAVVVLKENDKTENLSEEIKFDTAQPTAVAYLFNPAENKLTLYGLKQSGKKLELEYKPSGTQLEFKKLESKENVENGSVSFTFENDLGFDNTYEFKVKYPAPTEGTQPSESDYLDFENKTKSEKFTTQAAPTIKVETENGLNIKLDQVNPSVNKDYLFIRYKDKENSNTWIEKPVNTIPGFDTGNLTLPDLLSDTNYEAQLIYKKPSADNSGTTTTTILSEVEFRTNKNFTFDISKSVVGSKKALLSFRDNNKLANVTYENVSLKLSKVGASEVKTFTLTKVAKNDDVFAQASLTELEANSMYAWSLNEGDKILSSGTLKTGLESDVEKDSANTNAYEDKETNFVAVDNRLSDGVFVSVKNTFGYITNDDANKYYPTEISIKYYLKDNPAEVQTETLFVTLSDIKNKELFTKQINELGEGIYTFEVSYKNGFDKDNNEVLVSKTFDINYKYPEISFNSETSKLTINNLDAFNDKDITIKYNDGSEAVLSLVAHVTNNQIDVKLPDLRSERTYDLWLEIDSKDIEFKSSKQDETRAQFFGNGATDKLVLTSSFETKEQTNIIWVKHEGVNRLNLLTEIYVILEDFKSRPNKNMKVVVGTEEQMKAAETSGNYDAEGLKSFTKLSDENGHVDRGGQWITGLTAKTDYRIKVFEVKDNDELEFVTERSYRTPDVELAKVQKLEIIGSNTDDPKFKLENLEAFKKLNYNSNTNYNGQFFIRAQKIQDGKPFEEFDKITEKQFGPSTNGLDFNHLKFTKNNFNDLGHQGKVISIKSFIGANNDKMREWFTDGNDYQIILTMVKDNKEYVVASNTSSNLIHMNYSAPKFEGNIANTLVQSQDESKKITAKVEFKLRDVTQYIQTAEGSPKLKAVYVKSNDTLASANPSIWHEAKVVEAPGADDNGIATVAFENLEPNTYYNFAFVDSENNLILSKDRVKTAEVPRLRNTTLGDTIMRYTLSGLKGTESFIPHGTYAIKYGKNGSFDYKSDEFTLAQDTNLNNDVVFTLQDGLEPNTTYDYKLVNKENDNVLLSFQDIFRTNKSQSEETVIGNDFAIVKLLNPSYTLREASYSIAKRGQVGTDDADKTILDVLKMQYSTSSEFTNYKEFSVSLSENEANLLAIKLKDLEPNTKYYYRLVKGTVKANIVKSSGGIIEEPVQNLDTEHPELTGSFTTLNTTTNISSTLNGSTLSFDVPSVNGANEVYLSFKKQDSTNIYDVKYDYKLVDGKVVFELDNLQPSTVYEYSLTSLLDNSKLANGLFTTDKVKGEIKSRIISIGDTYKRLELSNINDYLGQKIKIKHKQTHIISGAERVSEDVETVLTNENNEFLWDFDNLEAQNKHKIEVFLLDENGQEIKSLLATEFTALNDYSSGDKTVTTNVRTLGNYELNRWYTITTLQEIYANQSNWKEQVEKSLSEIAIFGTEVSNGPAYGWHKLIAPGTTHRYYRVDGEKLIYEYIFVDTFGQPDGKAKVKGLKFELQLVGNTVQVKILEAKAKPEIVDKIVVVSQYKWSELTDNLEYKAANGIVHQSDKDVAGHFINISGFKFNATTAKRGKNDFNVPQVFRYSVEEALPGLDKKTAKESNAGSFIKLSNEKQREKYGNYTGGESNYDIAYKQYVSEGNRLLPFNANFLLTPSSHEYLYANDPKIYAPAFIYDSQLREKFFRYLKENGKIRFTGADVVNKDWIFFNSKDIVMFADETSVYSDKYLTEFPFVKLLIWKDGNQLKGLRLTLNDADGSNGGALGMLDDYVYYLDNNNINLETLTWDKFTKLATKHTVNKYMNPDSPGTAIAGIGFVSKDKAFINNSTQRFTNPQNTVFSAELESQSGDNDAQVRKIKLFNAPEGEYTLKVEYPIFFPTAEKDRFTEDIQPIVINESNKNFFELDLSDKLKYGTEYKVTLSKGNEVIKELSGLNLEASDGVTAYSRGNFKLRPMGIYDNPNRNQVNTGNPLWANNPTVVDSNDGYNQWRVGFNSSAVTNRNIDTNDEARNVFKTTDIKFLIGTPRLSADQTMRYKWSVKTKFIADNKGRTSRKFMYYTAALSDDGQKAIVMRVVFLYSLGNGNVNAFIAGAKEYTLNEQEKTSLDNVDIGNWYNSGTDIVSDVINQPTLPADYFDQEGNKTKVSVFGVYVKSKFFDDGNGSTSN